MQPPRVLVVAVAAAVTTGVLAGVPAQAFAGSGGGCATQAEVNRLRLDMTPAKVRKIIGAAGKETMRTRKALEIEFKPCAPRTHSNAYVQFDRERPSKPFRAWDYGFYYTIS